MNRRLTHIAIGGGIALSLLGWGAGRLGEVTLEAIRPDIQAATIAAHNARLPKFSVHLSIEVRP
ncbi:hypothetical protein [Sphingomonas sanguinis]|jgi:hypothetical protein|uniref:Uncharacterized protein n=1 Tax=Sphingomonas sanguinis TaxID=33051 RepID=A0A7Y7QSS9_9SPHN|nr:hypothetical protein [Sphingomonas sanguinis]MBZ6380723.1 hypothetical protein [Sphingomonas sanguinis]NNG49466.1 hypothetical protein [Sphingomonas sanguinis]NNG53356.1 hypothetical protein [Sphingomonas sanguinis]NVP30025.1 hypothetical protein [Sphingomonas sanguinis]